MGKLFTAEKTLNLPTPHEPGAIDHEDILHAQARWAEAIVDIGRTYLSEGDFHSRAEKHILELYGFETGPVLFKPTLASEHPFRTRFDEALSYFVGGPIAEDRGFALRPWSSVTFGAQQIMLSNNVALAMGDYVFTPHNRNEPPVRVEFSFGYIRAADGSLRICLHHSSLPYQPAEAGT